MPEKLDILPPDYFISKGEPYLRELLDFYITESKAFNHNKASLRHCTHNIKNIMWHLEKHGAVNLLAIADEYLNKITK